MQAERLGKYLVDSHHHLTHIFTSDLQRAFKTASALRQAQIAHRPEAGESIHVRSTTILREQDFGSFEGKPYSSIPRESRGSSATEKDHGKPLAKDASDFKGIESKESVTRRMNSFLDDYLIPLIKGYKPGDKLTVAIVSHGLVLAQLWRCFLKLLPPNTVQLAADVLIKGRAGASLEHLGAWSNTGYLELLADHSEVRNQKEEQIPLASVPSTTGQGAGMFLPLTKLRILTVDGKEHLAGLKRTRGVGSSQHDENQKTIESFFKKRRVHGDHAG